MQLFSTQQCPTGSGKTIGIANIIESAIVRRCPLFYVDGKGDLELAKRVQRFATDWELHAAVSTTHSIQRGNG